MVATLLQFYPFMVFSITKILRKVHLQVFLMVLFEIRRLQFSGNSFPAVNYFMSSQCASCRRPWVQHISVSRQLLDLMNYLDAAFHFSEYGIVHIQ